MKETLPHNHFHIQTFAKLKMTHTKVVAIHLDKELPKNKVLNNSICRLIFIFYSFEFIL